MPTAKLCSPLSTLTVSLVCLSLFLAGCGDKKQAPTGPPPAPVSLTTVQSKSMPYYILAVGQVATLESVTVRSRVTGYLQEKHFQQGAFVKSGEKLFTIDPSQYLAQIKSLKAQLASDKTSYEQARRDFDRYSRLLRQAVVSKEDFEQKRLEMRTAQDQIAMTQADLANAQNDLRYCYIDSPLSGLAGYIYPSVGDLIGANADQLVVINQIQPIAVNFHVPQRYMPEITKHMGESSEPLTTIAIIPGEDELQKGNLTFYDNTVNKDTGTIWLQGSFPNEQMKLWPGNFVQVRLKLFEQKDAVIVPYQTTCYGSEGEFVWVALQNKTVEMRPVKVDRRSGKFDVISEGLKAGEMVVTDGQLRLYPGAAYVVAQSPDVPNQEEPFETSSSGGDDPPSHRQEVGAGEINATGGNATGGSPGGGASAPAHSKANATAPGQG